MTPSPRPTAIGFPVVVKLCGDAITHKTERGLVRLRLGDERAVRDAAAELLDAALPSDGDVSLLVAPMVAGNRELIAGMLRDRQFGPTVMLGVGGILAEAVADVVFRPAPLDRPTAGEMIDDLVAQKLLGPFRGDAEVDRDRLVDLLVGLGRLAVERADVASVDVNPLIVGHDGLTRGSRRAGRAGRRSHRTGGDPTTPDPRAVRRPRSHRAACW